MSCMFSKRILMISPALMTEEGFAIRSLIMTRPPLQASLATVRRLMIRDTFRNLSILIFILTKQSPQEAVFLRAETIFISSPFS